MPSDIVLIGPFQTGKSTLGKLLAEKLSVPQVSLDDLRRSYAREIGYDDDLAQELRQRGGFLASVLYGTLFRPYALERMLSEHCDCVFDLGAGPIVFESDEQVQRIQSALEPYPNVLLILPSPDSEESIEILRERARQFRGHSAQGFDWAAFFVNHPANHDLAKFVVYTAGKTPEETRDEILELVT